MVYAPPPAATSTGAPDEWAPSDEPLGPLPFGHDESHGDVPEGVPESEEYGRDTKAGGSTPDARLNLLDDVRQAQREALPPIEVHHVMENVERGAEVVRVHQETVNGQTPTTLLQQNPQRKRALIRAAPSGVAGFVVLTPTLNNSTTMQVTVPAGQSWTIQSFLFTFTTSAVVGNRQLLIVVTDPGGRTVAQYQMTVTQAAGLNNIVYQPITGATTDSVVGSTHYYPNIYDGLVLAAGSKITVSNVGFNDAGDNFGAPQGDITASGGSGSLFLMPSRDGANITASAIGWLLQAGEVIEIKSQAALDGVGGAAGVATLVYVYEELVGTMADTPGLA